MLALFSSFPLTMTTALPVYTAAKHGVVGFVRSYGKHLPIEQISLNAICPGVVRTNISTVPFYEMMEGRNLLVPMVDVVAAFEQCLDSDISGEALEIEPRSGVVVRAGLEPLDKDTDNALAVLKLRGAPLHVPKS
jgi:NAD(P)-dependent dehydrogenase (short-subunit alcohol dehydrogenase family)